MVLQAKLISEWINVGFIHGVMNTDNHEEFQVKQ